MELQRCPGPQDLTPTTHPYHQPGWSYWWYSAPTPQQPAAFKDHKEKKDEDPWSGLDAQSAFLGPNLWGTPQDQNFKLEYADLEEFLEDNEPPRSRSAGGAPGAIPADSGPPLAPPQRQQQQPQGQQQPQHHQPPPGHQHGHQQPSQGHQHGHHQAQQGRPPQQQHPSQPQQGHQQQHQQQHHHQQQPQQQQQQPQQAHAQQRKQQKQQCPSLPGSDRDTANGDEDPYRAEYRFENGVKVKVEFRVSPTDLALASGPGAPDFDPQTRQFSDEELKPQPMCKKSKKQVVPDDRKDQKYWMRRQRNNSAAKRSRDARRLKENQIALRASFLEKENAALREAVDELTKKNQELQNELDSCNCR